MAPGVCSSSSRGLCGFYRPFSFVGVKAMAEESGDGDRVKVIQDELNELEERAEALDRQRTKNISAIRYQSCTHTRYPRLSELVS